MFFELRGGWGRGGGKEASQGFGYLKIRAISFEKKEYKESRFDR